MADVSSNEIKNKGRHYYYNINSWTVCLEFVSEKSSF